MPANGDDDDLAAHSRFNNNQVVGSSSSTSAANRAYCDLCESFGHEESECTQSAAKYQKNASDEEF